MTRNAAEPATAWRAGESLSPDVVVVGSANVDHVIRVIRLPAPGETVVGPAVVTGAGGKGANQAQAIAQLGARVAMVGCVGDDANGSFLLDRLRSAGVDVTAMHQRADQATGAALIVVDAAGENTVTVGAGANALLDRSAVLEVIERAAGARIVAAQGEIPAAAVAAAGELADRIGARFVLNLEPVLRLPPPVLAHADPLVVNEHEAAQLIRAPPASGPAAAAALAAGLARACRSVVVTLGSAGAVWAEDGRSGAVPAVAAPKVDDTTGAGDAFVAALSVALIRGSDLELAVAYGVVAGSHAVTLPGANFDMPPVEALVTAAERHAAAHRRTRP